MLYGNNNEKDKLHSDAIDLGHKIISVAINIMDCILSCIAHQNSYLLLIKPYCISILRYYYFI